MENVSSLPTARDAISAPTEERDPFAFANVLLREELPAWMDQLSDEILSAYKRTEVGRNEGSQPIRQAVKQYLTELAEPSPDARAASRNRMASLYAHAGLDLAPHFEVSSRLFALIADSAARRFGRHPHRLASALTEVQRRLWEDARLITEAFVHSRERHLDHRGNQLALAQSELVKLAHDDGLTGVRNRSYLLETLSLELERAHRYHEPFSLLFADLDHFKEVNDAHGHEAGDELLRNIAVLLKRAVRPHDVVGRYGGDEFVIGLVRTNAPTARRIAERLRASVEAAHLPGRDTSPIVTVSVGVVTMHDESEGVPELLRMADAAMYAAKAAGRNRVRQASRAPIRRKT
jgi:diguanylate cyclase (GGDEF)-like protein